MTKKLPSIICDVTSRKNQSTLLPFNSCRYKLYNVFHFLNFKGGQRSQEATSGDVVSLVLHIRHEFPCD